MKISSTVLLITLYALSFSSLHSQPLPRKGSLGTYLTALPDTLDHGAQVSRIIHASTAAQLGLEVADIVRKLNGELISQPSDVVRLASKFVAGDSISLLVHRGPEELLLTGVIVEKPREQSSSGVVLYDHVSFQGNRLRSISHLPDTLRRHPVVFYIQGFSCASIDNGQTPLDPIMRFTDSLVAHGFAVFKVEKPGVGDSDGPMDCRTINHETEIDAYGQALVSLYANPYFDTSNIFLFGHSLGGIAAPLIAREKSPKGIIVFGTVLRSWYEYMIDIYRRQPVHFGTDWKEIEVSTRNMIPLLYELLILKKEPADLIKNPDYKKLLEDGALAYDGEQILYRDPSFWHALQDVDLTDAWSKLESYVHAIHGEFDVHAIAPYDARLIADIINSYHPGRGTFTLLQHTEHGFARVPSMQEYTDMRSRGQVNSAFLYEHFNPQLITSLIEWMDRVGSHRPRAYTLHGRPLFDLPESADATALKDSLLWKARKDYFQDSTNVENIIWYGRRLAYMTKISDAIEVYTSGIRLHPQSAKLHRHRGHRYITLRQFDKAISDLTTAASLMNADSIEIEPDGIPNRMNKPLSSLQFNVWYHLGLAQYLKGNFEQAQRAYEHCLKYSTNPDLWVATADWLYMTLMRRGLNEEAEALLEQFDEGAEIIENESYRNRLMFYQGKLTESDLLDPNEVNDDLILATQGYGVGNWHFYMGNRERATAIWERVIQSNYWPAFGFIAAESDLQHLKTGNRN